MSGQPADAKMLNFYSAVGRNKEPAILAAEKLMSALFSGDFSEEITSGLDPAILFVSPMAHHQGRPIVKAWLQFEFKMIAPFQPYIRVHSISTDDGMKSAVTEWSCGGAYFTDRVQLSPLLQYLTITRTVEIRHRHLDDRLIAEELLREWTGPYFSPHCGPKVGAGIDNNVLMLPQLDFSHCQLSHFRSLLSNPPHSGSTARPVTDLNVIFHFMRETLMRQENESKKKKEADEEHTRKTAFKTGTDEGKVTIKAKNRDGDQRVIIIDKAELNRGAQGSKVDRMEDEEVANIANRHDRQRFICGSVRLRCNQFGEVDVSTTAAAAGGAGSGIAAVRAAAAAAAVSAGDHLGSSKKGPPQRPDEPLATVLKLLVVNAFQFLTNVDLSSNRLRVIPDLSELPLVGLALHDNDITCWNEVATKLAPLRQLQSLTLFSNPIQSECESARTYKYCVLSIFYRTDEIKELSVGPITNRMIAVGSSANSGGLSSAAVASQVLPGGGGGGGAIPSTAGTQDGSLFNGTIGSTASGGGGGGRLHTAASSNAAALVPNTSLGGSFGAGGARPDSTASNRLPLQSRQQHHLPALGLESGEHPLFGDDRATLREHQIKAAAKKIKTLGIAKAHQQWLQTHAHLQQQLLYQQQQQANSSYNNTTNNATTGGGGVGAVNTSTALVAGGGGGNTRGGGRNGAGGGGDLNATNNMSFGDKAGPKLLSKNEYGGSVYTHHLRRVVRCRQQGGTTTTTTTATNNNNPNTNVAVGSAGSGGAGGASRGGLATASTTAPDSAGTGGGGAAFNPLLVGAGGASCVTFTFVGGQNAAQATGPAGGAGGFGFGGRGFGGGGGFGFGVGGQPTKSKKGHVPGSFQSQAAIAAVTADQCTPFISLRSLDHSTVSPKEVDIVQTFLKSFVHKRAVADVEMAQHAAAVASIAAAKLEQEQELLQRQQQMLQPHIMGANGGAASGSGVGGAKKKKSASAAGGGAGGTGSFNNTMTSTGPSRGNTPALVSRK